MSESGSDHDENPDTPPPEAADPSAFRRGFVISAESFATAGFDPAQFVNNVLSRTFDDVGAPPQSVMVRRKGAGSTTGQQQEQQQQNPSSPSSANSKPTTKIPPLNVAGMLVMSLKEALEKIIEIEGTETARLVQVEGACRAVEAQEMLHLGMVNAALEGTSARLRDFEEKLRDAIAATVGVDRSLSQASSRVARGRVVEELLRNFESFAQCGMTTLSTVLDEATTARRSLRTAVTKYWAAEGNATLSIATLGSVFYTPLPEAVMQRPEVQDALRSEKDNANRCKLGRTFIAREQMESAVAWTQRLFSLSKDLPADAGVSTAQIGMYLNWLQRELVAECFHLIESFGALYDARPALATSHPHGKVLLKALDLTAKLHLQLTDSSEALLDTVVEHMMDGITTVLEDELPLTPLPAQPPMGEPVPQLACDFFKQKTRHEIGEAFEFVMERLQRDMLVIDTMFGATKGPRQALLAGAMDLCVREFVSRALQMSDAHKIAMIQAEARAAPQAKRKAPIRVNDGLAFHLSVLNELFVCCVGLLDKVAAKFGKPARDCMAGYMDALFPGRTAYIQQNVELELLKRVLSYVEVSYVRELAVHPGEVFDMRPEHATKAKDILTSLDGAVARVKSLAPVEECAAVVESLYDCCIKGLARFLEEELTKVEDGLRSSMSSWQRPPKNPEEFYLVPQRSEIQLAAARMLAWSESVVCEVYMSIARHCQQIPTGSIAFKIETMASDAFAAVDDKGEVILQLICQALVVKSLSILRNHQDRHDYDKKESKRPKDGEDAPPPQTNTKACQYFCAYVSWQLDELRTFLRAADAAAIAANEALAAGGEGGGSASTALKSGAAGGGAGGYSARTPSMETSGDSKHRRTASQTLQETAASGTLFKFLDQRGTVITPTRMIGVALFKGLFAHVTDFFVSDIGAVVYMSDTSAYRRAVRVLTEGANGTNDAGIIATLFDLLKETAGLLMVPLDNIQTVKESGNLRLLPKDEKQRVLKMRVDLKEAWRIMNSS